MKHFVKIAALTLLIISELYVSWGVAKPPDFSRFEAIGGGGGPKPSPKGDLGIWSSDASVLVDSATFEQMTCRKS